MSRLALLIPCFLLAGCPGYQGHAGADEWRGFSVDARRLCFTVDKVDVLSRYVISTTHNGVYKEYANTDHVLLSYPDTCIQLALAPGYTYGASYTLNNANYRYVFFIDNDWNVVSLDRGNK